MVTLGFVISPEEASALGKDTKSCYESRIGGHPVFYGAAANVDDLKCARCEKAMSLLLQLYAPDMDDIHRNLYVFVCKTCFTTNWKDGCKVVRHMALEAKDCSACTVCGLNAPYTCANCKCAHYCSKDHQIMHWSIYDHKSECKSSLEANHVTAVKFGFKASFIETEEEEDDETEEIETLSEGVANTMALVPTKTIVAPEADDQPWGDEEYEKASADVDKAFLKFQKKLKHNRKQVIRYYRTFTEDDNDGSWLEPLWVADQGKLTREDVPNCELCGSQRTLEMQIMPQMLNYLDIDHVNPNAIDFGTLLIYSCDKNCSEFLNDGRSWTSEFIYRQDFSSEGIGYEQKKARFGYK
ncbi:hypothetical protein MP638_001215 [Amoeboaphelidium occidentale]|nr:hypothetical protein MP638_001215 [Amoeboaphelidium occidentale]